ncbi:RelA/SpoT family protein [Hirschia baltica]|uniref:GTP pyrophosphokinase rsh n=1 Tax=Hirschia baltica (strain ATCC 49814 / DSM 5838 / IFAM 1418) TaxID=582402 RepID=C6XJG1_HIRBI|nr:bifunctional (p)ppGpp synthetase/guanosine-3',5'-bis(diphosphate) 3'-pyrophosphohydrolase [Hirschia baltica]ACT59256.1 (p)ppGpp synthetase I, SpoT/RelA [Hirschia baltica ATCC 49814]
MADDTSELHAALREPGLPTGKGRRFLRQYELVERVLAYQPDADEDALNRAYVFAMVRHGAQTRHSGDPYYAHPVSVAGILTDLKLDYSTIIAGLLHDTVEDTDVTLEEIEELFSKDIAEIVDGVTKLTQLESSSRAAKQAENFQKFILATTKDIRVLLVKLADRLHNMRTIQFMPKPESRIRIAQETIDIYAPLARRTGLSIFAGELEDIAFAVINPEARETIERRLAEMAADAVEDVERIQSDIEVLMSVNGISGDIRGRLKRPYSIWRKLENKAISFKDLGDIFAFRLIVPSVADCYRALGIAHQHWAALSGRFKDYISVPKPNGYQSIHTTFQGPGNRRVELQIRTKQMDEIAERGIAAHWRYKNKNYGFDKDGAREAGLDPEDSLLSFADMLGHGADPEEFLEHAKMEMFRDTVFAFTPRGRLVKLPDGAMPLDFAYTVHTAVGDECVGVRINGIERPLRTLIQNGDTIEIIRGPRVEPPANWRSLVVTGRARSAIRRLTRDKEQEEFTKLGRQKLNLGLRRIGLDPIDIKFRQIAVQSGMATTEELLEELGRGFIDLKEILSKTFPEHIESEMLEGRHAIDDDETESLLSGEKLIPGVALHLSECCSPLPGDRIVGVQIAGKGVDVHVIDCQRLMDFDSQPEVWMDLSWRPIASTDFFAVSRILIALSNQRGSLATVCKTISEANGNIINIAIKNRNEDFFDFQFDVEVEDKRRLTQILAALRALSAVESVDRIRGSLEHDSKVKNDSDKEKSK